MTENKEALQLIAELKELVKEMGDCTRMKGEVSVLKGINDTGLKPGKVTWTRLYEQDDEAMEKISLSTNRKSSQIIRMMVHYVVKNDLVKEFIV